MIRAHMKGLLILPGGGGGGNQQTPSEKDIFVFVLLSNGLLWSTVTLLLCFDV